VAYRLLFSALFFSASPFSGPRRHALLVPVSIPVEQIAALPLARDCGLGRVCLTLWFFNNHICHRMLVREPVHGMQGAGERQKHQSLPNTRTPPGADLHPALAFSQEQGV
jgi:hypothetical protein